jgi:hypothetical protein
LFTHCLFAQSWSYDHKFEEFLDPLEVGTTFCGDLNSSPVKSYCHSRKKLSLHLDFSTKKKEKRFENV